MSDNEANATGADDASHGEELKEDNPSVGSGHDGDDEVIEDDARIGSHDADDVKDGSDDEHADDNRSTTDVEDTEELPFTPSVYNWAKEAVRQSGEESRKQAVTNNLHDAIKDETTLRETLRFIALRRKPGHDHTQHRFLLRYSETLYRNTTLQTELLNFFTSIFYEEADVDALRRVIKRKKAVVLWVAGERLIKDPLTGKGKFQVNIITALLMEPIEGIGGYVYYIATTPQKYSSEYGAGHDNRPFRARGFGRLMFYLAQAILLEKVQSYKLYLLSPEKNLEGYRNLEFRTIEKGQEKAWPAKCKSLGNSAGFKEQALSKVYKEKVILVDDLVLEDKRDFYQAENWRESIKNNEEMDRRIRPSLLYLSNFVEYHTYPYYPFGQLMVDTCRETKTPILSFEKSALTLIYIKVEEGHLCDKYTIKCGACGETSVFNPLQPQFCDEKHIQHFILYTFFEHHLKGDALHNFVAIDGNQRFKEPCQGLVGKKFDDLSLCLYEDKLDSHVAELSIATMRALYAFVCQFPTIYVDWIEAYNQRQEKRVRRAGEDEGARPIKTRLFQMEETAKAIAGDWRGPRQTQTSKQDPVTAMANRHHRADSTYTDLQFQSRMTHLEWIVPTERSTKRTPAKDGSNIKAHWAGWIVPGTQRQAQRGKHLPATCKALIPKWVIESDTFSEEFLKGCTDNANERQTLSAAVRKELRRRFSEYSDSQIVKVKRKFTAARKGGVKGGKAGAKTEWLGKDGKDNECHLTNLWMVDCFVKKFNEGPWYESLKAKKMRNKWVNVPPGAVVRKRKPCLLACAESIELQKEKRQRTIIPSSLLVKGAPPVRVQQGESPTCVFSSLASALFVAGDDFAGRYIMDTRNASLEARDRMDFVIQKMWGKPTFYTPKRLKNFDILSDWSPHPTVCKLKDSQGGVSHCITVWNSWIFDSNYQQALPICKEALDWCCGEKKEITFVRVLDAIRCIRGHK